MLGVLLQAIVVSIMAVNWAQLISPECENENMVQIVLMISISIGLISVVVLLFLRQRNSRSELPEHKTSITFLKIKLISLYIFGLGYMFHCGLYTWKNFSNDICPENSDLSIAFNILSILYTFILFIYFAQYYERCDENTFGENAASLGIFLTNACIWFNALFSESNSLFKNQMISDNSTTVINVTISEKRAIEAIEKSDPFLSPAMIEFSLISIDMLFLKHVYSTQTSKSTNSNDSVNETEKDDVSRLPSCVRITGQVFVSLVVLTLFVFTFVVVITNDPSNDILDHPDDFNVYVIMQLIIKLLLLILISISLFVEWSCLAFHLNVSAFVLLVTCFGNVVYHTLYCVALYSEGKKNESQFIGVSWADNIISMFLALFQTVFILGTHLPKDYEHFMCHTQSRNCKSCLHNKFVHYACCLLGILNLGLWISISIGEGRLPVFTISIYKAYDKIVWSFINKIILPLTIFFRFHTGLDFLEFYWKHNSMKRN